MSLIPDEVVEQVRDSADLLALVGESVDLKRTGSDWRGPCPFHGGTHRNFAVIPKKGRYYCFVCHASGDAFSWLMQRFGMDYPTAVREVARRSGIVIPERPGRAGPDPREPLFAAVAAAHDWLARQLLEGAEAAPARDYLAGRDLPLETAGELGLGFAPAGRGFLDAMRELGIGEPVLLEAGLAARRESGEVVPRFRGRLLFPIHDLRGRLSGFGGRLLGPGEPKYLNSPESPIFQKGKLLYHLHAAKGAIRREEHALLVEGYFDVLRLALAGIEHVVAGLGTALTPDQAALLRRFAPAATLLYDSDQAGLRATFRAADELLRHRVRVRVATLPPGEDPDSLVRAGGAAALEPVLRDAVDVLERKLQLLERRGWFEGVEHRREALDRLLPTAPGTPRAPVARREPPRPERRLSPEEQLLRAIVAAPELIDEARRDLPASLFESPAQAEVYEALLHGRPGDVAAQLPGGLSDAAALAWERVKEATQDLAGRDVRREYEAARQILLARRQYLELRTILDPVERKRRRASLQALYPEADKWYSWQREQRRGAAPPDPAR